MRRMVVVLAAATSLVGGPVAAQSAEAEALAVVQRLFDGMRTRDTALLRSVFAPDARMLTVLTPRGVPPLEFSSADEFVRIVGSATGPAWDERIHHTEVKVDGTLASVWAPYDFYLGDRFSHCGVDAVHLAKTAEGWKIVGLADTQRREGCGTK